MIIESTYRRQMHDTIIIGVPLIFSAVAAAELWNSACTVPCLRIFWVIITEPFFFAIEHAGLLGAGLYGVFLTLWVVELMQLIRR